MPHFNIEYTSNLDEKVNFTALCGATLETVLSERSFEKDVIRVCAFKADAYAIADRLPENAFIDIAFCIGKCRSVEGKKATGERIFSAVSDKLAIFFATPYLDYH